MTLRGVPLRERLLARHVVDETTGCWNFIGGTFDGGYGAIGSGGEYGLPRTTPAHRAAYCVFVGPIPAGHVVHQRCENHRCINPAHLVTAAKHAVNAMASGTLGYQNTRKTHCLNGHPLSGDNLYLHARRDGSVRRLCRACQRQRGRDSDNRRRKGIVLEKPKAVAKPRRRTGRYHFGSGTRLYRVWSGMLDRCTNPKQTSYANYGGRGITVCDAWYDFVPFAEWAVRFGYDPAKQIDRINNDAGYSPENCRWVTVSENLRNTRRNRLIHAFGEVKCATAWAFDPRCSVSPGTIVSRMQHGLTPEQAITDPRRSHQNAPRFTEYMLRRRKAS